MVQKVAVIGAGISGLTSIKSCLEEGLEPTCFESGPDIGGLWRFKEEPEPGRANIYETVVLNTSKERMAFSDFPPPAQLPNNMHHSEVLLYLRLYAQNFGLLPHIRFKTAVVGVRQTTDFDVTGQWEVETEALDGRRQREVFDAVIVSTGCFTTPHLPLKEFQGLESFNGKYFHSWEYRNTDGLQGKRVVVIGIGSSGGEIAVDISRVAEKVYLSSRSGAWVVSRVGPRGLPVDMVHITRMDRILQKLFPSLSNKMTEKIFNKVFDHELYGLKPRHRIFQHNVVVSDNLPAQIISGRVQLKPNIKQFCGSTLVFADGSSVEKVDVVVFATGYNYSFPFLPLALQEKSGHRLCLYKHVFPPRLSRPTLAVVGFISGLGSFTPLAEMQARWATRVFKGLSNLPTEQTMLDDIATETETMHKRYVCSERTPIHVPWIPYLDFLATEIGVRPSMMRLLLSDPKLALQVFFGPCTSYQYRLTGPGHWDGARQAIFSQWDRVLRPFNSKVVPKAFKIRLVPRMRIASKLSMVLFSGAALLYGSFNNI
ncbi:flavin-containing monooxygenase 5-like [Corythoichthys intestinalis]|uniref:flavin-containing monooxygenase 5-like n=1 Tax=Corythoichthys intestinalis TaxID=161448 RepID=UPI0025A5C142|nr:flavin-containing monooxygenase 5-like [Corythoichthys intestinalis]XP_061790660.1 flavin-containing monooxygenase 5-like [Nerophis lumbriciformis]